MPEDGASYLPLQFWIQVVIFVVSLVISAFFSGSETALTSMTKLRVKRLFIEDESAYKKLEGWLNDPNRYLATILVGNNFVNILASVIFANITERLLITQFGLSENVAFSSSVAVAITTFLFLVFGEICPKTYSKEHAPQISLRIVGILDVIYKFLRPLIWIFLGISNTIIRLFGGTAVKEVPLITEEDVRALIEMSENEGLLEQEEREMIHSIIDFGDTLVREIMTPRVDLLTLNVDAPYEQVMHGAVEWGHSRIPVYEQDLDRVIGILYVKDLLRLANKNTNLFDLRSILRHPLFIPKSKRVGDLLRIFKKEKNHMAVVVDEYGLTAGVVTIEDVIEEIVGDIQDEYDTEEPSYELQTDGVMIADGKIDLDILVDVLDIEFPEEDVETLGGFISTLLGTVPKVGEEISYDSLKFTIMDSDERKINKVKIERVSAQVEEPTPVHQGQTEISS